MAYLCFKYKYTPLNTVGEAAELGTSINNTKAKYVGLELRGRVSK